jgi:hypothetical protein
MSTSQPTQVGDLTVQRQAWIAEAAYYRAERRSFEGGCPIEDWLAAEREINPSATEPVSAPRVALVFLDRRPTCAAD